MIAVRRVPSVIPLLRLYEVHDSGRTGTTGESSVSCRGSAVRRLEKIVGVGDAWALINAADRALARGEDRWVDLFG